MRRLAWLAVCVVLGLSATTSMSAQSPSNTLIVVAGISEADVAAEVAKDAVQRGYHLVELPSTVVEIVGQLKAEIEDGKIFEDGLGAPAHLDAFSGAVRAVIPNIFGYKYIRVISDQMFPIELVRRGKHFLGDIAQVAHEFPVRDVTPREKPRSHKLPFSRYVIDAVIGMPRGHLRANQDIIQVALKLEHEIPVELNFGGGTNSLPRLLARQDVTVLHIDTHGGPGGEAIQVSREGAMLNANDIPPHVRAPLVLLFGCEGVASRKAFGAVLQSRGAEVVISSFAKFNSFGLTGDPAREKQIYEAFFSSLRTGETVGAALVKLRQAASREAKISARGATLTRLLFVLVGRDDLALLWPKVSEP